MSFLHHTIPYGTRLYGVPVGELMRFGQEAVILFFLLSGFVINYSFKLSKNKTFGNYFAKRFCRIYIPLFAVMFISYFTESYEAGRLLGPDFINMFGNLFMLQDWGNAYPNVIIEPYMGNGPLWSLSYEWWFYMMFFPITMLLPNFRIANIVVFSVSIAAAVVYVFYPLFIVRIFMYSAIWWAGGYIGVLYLENRHREIRSLLLPCVVLTGIIIVLIVNAIIYVRTTENTLYFGFHPFNEVRHFVFALIAILGGWLWIKSGWFLYDLTIHHFRYFAPVSYAMYICHDPIMRNATYLAFIENPVFRWIGYFMVMLVVSYLIEMQIYPKVRRFLQPRIELLINSLSRQSNW